MAELERLTIDQLAVLERLLVEQEAPVVQRLRPPASDEALAMVGSYLEAPLPNELREWWGWHNGTGLMSNLLKVRSALCSLPFRRPVPWRPVESCGRGRWRIRLRIQTRFGPRPGSPSAPEAVSHASATLPSTRPSRSWMSTTTRPPTQEPLYVTRLAGWCAGGSRRWNQVLGAMTESAMDGRGTLN